MALPATLLALALASANASAQEPILNEPNHTGFTEDGPPVLLTPGATIAYRPGRVLRAASVRIVRPQAGERLYFVQQLGITGTYNSGTGVLTLRGRARVSDYERALRSVWYEHTGDAPAAHRTVVMRVVDRHGRASKPARAGVQVTAVNDAPQVAPASGTFQYRLGGGHQVLAPGIAVLDPDSSMSGATVAISSGFVSGEDELAYATANPGVTGTYDSGTGVLTLTGTASAARYQDALRAVTYRNTSNSPSGPRRTVTIQVTDVQGSRSGTALIDMDYTNRPSG